VNISRINGSRVRIWHFALQSGRGEIFRSLSTIIRSISTTTFALIDRTPLITNQVHSGRKGQLDSLFGRDYELPFGARGGGDVNDDRKSVQPCLVQPYPVNVWPETYPVVGRSRAGEPLYPYIGVYPVAVVMGRGKLAKIEVAFIGTERNSRRSSWGAASEARRLSRPRHPCCYVRFPLLRV
jgi:hypothetical protein